MMMKGNVNCDERDGDRRTDERLSPQTLHTPNRSLSLSFYLRRQLGCVTDNFSCC